MNPLRFVHRLELEWKVLLLAAVLFIAFAWPVQRFFITRLADTLSESIDPALETTLRTELPQATAERRAVLKEHIERYRQTRVLLPLIVQEQERLLRALSAGLFVIFLLLSLWLLRRMTRPLKNIAQAVDRIAKGDTAEIALTSGGALGVVEQAVANLQGELVTLREKTRIQGMEAAWRDIARVMAHEIKNPLTPIRLTLDRIEERLGSGQEIDPAVLAGFIARVNDQVDMLERLVDQFRSFSREPEVNKTRFDCADLVHSVADGMGATLTTRITGDAMLLSDPYLLRQALLNLWKNALEADATMVTVIIAPATATVTLTIDDNGSGIEPDAVDRIWLPYVTGKKGGTGLGLPVVKRLVETLGGTISCSSRKDGGVRMLLTLPADKENNHDG